jgi:hypothetical protein
MLLHVEPRRLVLLPSILIGFLLAPGGMAQAQEPLVFGIFIGSIEEGARIFSPVRLLPFDHPDADNHEFPNPLVNHTSEVEALVHIGEQTGLRLRATLLRYPQPPVEEWPYPEFGPPPLDCIQSAKVEPVATEAALPGLRVLAIRDGRPLAFIVDTRGLTLRQRQMQRATSMGLDLTRAEFLARLGDSVPAGRGAGCQILVYPART